MIPRRAEQPLADAVTLILWFQALLFLIPSSYVLKGMGAIGAPSTVLAIGMFGLWLLARLVPGSGLDLRAQPVRVVVLLFAAAVLVSYAAANRAPLPGDELNGADRGLLVIVASLGITLITVDGVSKLERLRVLLQRFVDFATLVAIVGVVQYVAHADVISPLFGQLIVFTKNRKGSFGGDYRVGTSGDLIRPLGTAIHPIEFSVVLSMALPIAAAFALRDQEHHGFRRWWKALTLIVSMPMAQSRGGILAMAVAALVALPAWPKSARRGLLKAAPLLAVSMRLVFPGLLGTIRNLFLHFSSDPSYTTRTSDYALVPIYVHQHPWFGRGFGTFLPARYIFLDNQYLLGLIETGYVGVIAFSVVAITGIGIAGQAARWARDESDGVLARSIMGALAGAVLSMGTFDFLSFPMATGTFFLLLGCAGAMWRLLRDDAKAAGIERPPTRRTRRTQSLTDGPAAIATA